MKALAYALIAAICGYSAAMRYFAFRNGWAGLAKAGGKHVHRGIPSCHIGPPTPNCERKY
jgi:hypothetical protein